MTTDEWLAARTEQRADVMGGQRVLVGTRIPIASVGARLYWGEPVDVLRADFPTLTEEDCKQAFALYYFGDK